MSMFGQKDGTGRDNAGSPAAPPRPVTMGRKKSSAGTLTGLALVIAAGLGGGYYYMAGTQGDLPPPNPPLAEQRAPEIMPDTAPEMPVMPVQDLPPADMAAPPETAPETTPETTTETPAQDLPLPPSGPEQAQPETPPSADIAPMPADALPPPAAAPGVPETLDLAPSMPVDPAAAPLSPTDVPPAPADTLPAADLAAPPVETPPAPAPETGQAPATPVEAERALVENAPALDQMSHPDEPLSVVPLQGEITAQPAIVRPVPQEYLVVRKSGDAGDVDSRLTAARAALAQGKDQAALSLFSELAAEHPDDSRIMMGRAVAFQRLGMADDALSAYETVLTRDPRNLEALTNMLGLLKGQDPGMAAGKLSELRQTYPSNAEITAQLGIALGAAGDYPGALRYLDIAETLMPGSATVTYNRAVVYDKMGQHAQAAELYREILRRGAEGSLDQTMPLEAIRARLSTLR